MVHERWVRYPALAALAAVVLAAATLAIDEAIPPGAWPPWLRFAGANGRTLLGGIAGAIVTATAVVFWVRAMMLQMTAPQFPSRVLVRYVENRFDQGVLAYLLGVFLYTVAVVLAVPGPTAADTPPRLSIIVATLLSAGVLVAIVAVIRHSARATYTGRLLRQLSKETLAAVEEPVGLPDTDVLPPDTPPPARPGRVVRCRHTGWIRTIDVARLLYAVPPGGTVRCEVRFGQLLTPGDPLATWWSDDDRHQLDPEEVQAALPLGESHDADHDVTLGVRHLVDVTVASTSPGTPDNTAAYEAMKHLQGILRAALLNPAPSALAGRDGRVLLLPAVWSHEIVDDAFHPIREAVAHSPILTLGLLKTLGGLRRDLELAGERGWTPALERHARLALEALESSGALAAEVRRARHVADDYDLLAGAKVGAPH